MTRANVLAIDFTSKGFSRLETNSTESDPGDTLAGMLLGHKGARTAPSTCRTMRTISKTNAWRGRPSPHACRGLHPCAPRICAILWDRRITFASEILMDEVAFAAGRRSVDSA